MTQGGQRLLCDSIFGIVMRVIQAVEVMLHKTRRWMNSTERNSQVPVGPAQTCDAPTLLTRHETEESPSISRLKAS